MRPTPLGAADAKIRELQALSVSAPSRIRTCGLLLRRPPKGRDGRVSAGTDGQEIAASATISQGTSVAMLRRGWPGVCTRFVP
jgi:hypothetical protein